LKLGFSLTKTRLEMEDNIKKLVWTAFMWQDRVQ